MLTAFGAYLTAKTRVYQGLNNFSRILLYGGISSILFGALTGSWFGDLYKPEYLGKDNFLLHLQEMFVVIDPMDKTIRCPYLCTRYRNAAISSMELS